MSIMDWPENERPREKLLHHGAKYLSDAELIAIIFNSGIQGKNALDLARELLVKFGGLQKLCQLPPHLFYQTLGLGKAKFATLQAAIELGQRYLSSHIKPGEALTDSKKTKMFLANRLKNYPHEVFACLFLDHHHRIICFEELFRGTLTEASVYPREVVKRCLSHNAAKVIFAHNHPSGNAKPSCSDKEITRLLKKALQLIDIMVIDHIIIGHQENISLLELGML